MKFITVVIVMHICTINIEHQQQHHNQAWKVHDDYNDEE